MKVDVYKNLHKNCLSIRSRESEDYGKVVSHRPRITVANAEFVVQPGGRQRTIDSGVKNVHAFVRGEWNDSLQVIYGEPVVYNPFTYESFVHAETEVPVLSADVVLVTVSGVFAEGLSYSETNEQL